MQPGKPRFNSLAERRAFKDRQHKKFMITLRAESNRSTEGLAFSMLLGVLILAAIFAVIFVGPVHAENIDLHKIMMIESAGNARAYNPQDGGRGLYQITAICLKEYNAFHPRDQYTPEDLWNTSISNLIADWYLNIRIPQMLKAYGLADNPRNRIIAYNAGIRTLVQNREIPLITKRYLKKYFREV